MTTKALFCFSLFYLVTILILSHQLPPPLKRPHQGFFLYHFFHFIMFHKEIHRLFIHYSYYYKTTLEFRLDFLVWT